MSKGSAVARRQAPLRAHYAHDRTAAIAVKRVRTVKTPTTDARHGTVIPVGIPMFDGTTGPPLRWAAWTISPVPMADPKRVAILTAQAERLCVTLDTLRNGVPVDVSLDLGGSWHPEPNRAAHPAAT